MKKYALILGLLMPMVVYADCDSSGKCVWDCSPDGKTNTCTATFENGTLSISGTQMKNYSSGGKDGNTTYNITNAPWNDEAGHLKQITNVVIGSEMKNIGNWFLTGATSLEHISIPKNIESIGGVAFYRTGLKTVDWPSPLKTIYASAFQYTHLMDFSFLDGVETIGAASFNSVFLHADSPKSLIIPDSVKAIGQNAFTGNLYLQNIVLSENVTFIDSLAFDSSLQTIYCTGNIDVCKTNVGEAFADKVKQATAKKINGVTYVYDKNGNLITTSGHRKEKRIYTIEEANEVAGQKNTIRIKYR